MGDLTESSTRPFIRRHSVALSTTVNSFILNPLMGNIGSLTTLPLADGVLSNGAQKRVKDAIWNLERVGSVSELMALMEADVRKARYVKTKSRTRLRAKGQKSRKPVLA